MDDKDHERWQEVHLIACQTTPAARTSIKINVLGFLANNRNGNDGTWRAGATSNEINIKATWSINRKKPTQRSPGKRHFEKHFKRTR